MVKDFIDPPPLLSKVRKKRMGMDRAKVLEFLDTLRKALAKSDDIILFEMSRLDFLKEKLETGGWVSVYLDCQVRVVSKRMENKDD